MNPRTPTRACAWSLAITCLSNCSGPREKSAEAVQLYLEDEASRGEARLLAEEAAREAAEVLPMGDRGRADAWRVAAILHDNYALKAEAYENATRALEAAGRSDTEISGTLTNVVLSWLLAGRLDRALAAMQRLIAHVPEGLQRGNELMILSEHLWDFGHPAESVATLRQAVAELEAAPGEDLALALRLLAWKVDLDEGRQLAARANAWAPLMEWRPSDVAPTRVIPARRPTP